ncbi:MAG: hypothetical protein ACRDWH_05955 [Acidimicrobiia bacterium]
MSNPVLYIDRSDIREGKLQEVRDGIRDLVEFVEAREPQLIAYGFYINQAGTGLTLVAIHPDSASLELHLEIGGPAFRKFVGLIELRTIELYGRPSETALAQLQRKVEMLGERANIVLHDQDAGFMRFASA